VANLGYIAMSCLRKPTSPGKKRQHQTKQPPKCSNALSQLFFQEWDTLFFMETLRVTR
jgi:hypothetical protein